MRLRRRLVLVLLLACGAPDADSEPTVRLLLDGIHAHNIRAPGLAPGSHDYHALHGLDSALAGLKARGVEVDEVRTGRLAPDVLSKADVLLINLVSNDLPAFFPEEISAVRSFVRRGGGLLLVTDHSNCYHHVTKLEPLAEALGIRLTRESALEPPPKALGRGPGWIRIERFEPHPVTLGLRWIAFMTGGTVDDRFAVARLSERGWGDRWETAPYGENALRSGNLGNYGNFERDETERAGGLGVVLAQELGVGRVVQVADQNLLGNVWIRYGDNRQLVHNAIAWLSREPAVARLPDPSAPVHARVLLLDAPQRSLFGSDRAAGYYNASVELGRHVTTAVHDRVEATHELIVVAPRTARMPTALRARLETHLEAGRPVLWLGLRGALGAADVADRDALLAAAGRESTATSEGIRVHRLLGGAVLVELLDAERYANDQLAHPSQVGTEEQRRRAAAWVGRVVDLLGR